MFLIVISITVISLVLVVAADTYLIYAQKATKYTAKLLGDSVVPPVNTTAAGRAEIFIDNDHIYWKLNVTGINDPTMAHIHMAEKGANVTNETTIVADLFKSDKHTKVKFENTKGRKVISGEVYGSDLLGPMEDKTIADLQSAINARGLQIDLHTKNHPDGELRGTIKIPGGNATKQIADTVNTTLTT